MSKTDQQKHRIVTVSAFEALEGSEKTGSDWKITLIRAGVSANKRYYPPEVLAKAAPLFEKVKMYAAVGRDHNPTERGIRAIAGYVHNVRWNPVRQALEGEAHISDLGIRQSLRDWDGGGVLQDMAQLSVVTAPKYGRTRGGIRPVEEIKYADSVDIVENAAAGGSFDLILESVEGEDDMAVLTDEQKAEIQEMMGESISQHMKDALGETLPGMIKEAVGEMGTHKKMSGECGMCGESAGEMKDTPSGKKMCEGCGQKAMEMGMMHTDPTQMTTMSAEAKETTEQLQALRREYRNNHRDMLIGESKLPEHSIDRVKELFGDDTDYDLADVKAFIKAEKDYIAAQEKAAMEALKKEHAVFVNHVTVDETDKKLAKLDALFVEEGKVKLETNGQSQMIGACESLVEAYIDWNGYKPIGGEYPHTAGGREFIIQSFLKGMAYDSSSPRMREGLAGEALTTSDWAEVASDRMYKALIDNYNMFPQYQQWRRISSVIPAPDFKAQRRIKTGGYSDLVVVTEGTAYADFVDPSDEETSVTVQRLGGIVRRITRELLYNDDIGAIRRIPRDLGRSAARTLYKGIFITILQANATYGADSKALFHADHKNLTTGVLNGKTLNTAEIAMRQQKRYNDPETRTSDLGRSTTDVVDVLGSENQPRYLVVPSVNKGIAARLVNPSDQTRLVIQAQGTDKDTTIMDDVNRFDYLTPIIVDELDPGNTPKVQGFLIADPMMVEGIVVSFLGGREEPDIVIQSDPHYGDPFLYDATSIRVRHEWGAALTDFRPIHKIQGS